MSSSPIVNRIRIIPRGADFLEEYVGSRGEVYFDNDNNSLRLYNKESKGGFLLVTEKLLNDTVAGLSTGGSISNIFDLSNVNTNSVTLDADNGQGKILSWDQAVNAFVPTDLPTSSVGASVTINDNVPAESAAGDLWWNSNEGVLKIYYDDGTSQQWIDATPRSQGFSGSWNDLSDKPNFAAVATSGSYADLSNTPNVTGKAIAMSIVFG